ncbi:single-stranded DNA-binding protein [Bacillus infantis]|uniref:single-stranded DNA-binding protein n=1 Tax=Bacillus infantis TaxID=324767 RepID=UPI003CECAAB3
MNKWIGIGRLVADPEVRYTEGEQKMCIARYRLAVDRRFKKEGEQTADFISCVAFGKNGEFAEKYLKKGMKIAVSGRIQTGSYEKDGVKHYTTDIVAEEHDFCESKGASSEDAPAAPVDSDGFMQIPEGIEDALPFK